MLPPPSSGGTLQAYKNPNNELAFLSSNNAQKALIPLGNEISQLSFTPNNSNIVLPEQYNTNSPINYEYNGDAITFNLIKSYTDSVTGVTTVYGQDSNDNIYDITDPRNITLITSAMTYKDLEYVTPDGYLLYSYEDGLFYLVDPTLTNTQVITLPSGKHLSSGVVWYLNGTYLFIGSDEDTGEKSVCYTTDLINWNSFVPQYNPIDFCFAYGKYIMFTQDNIEYSTDLTSWTAISGIDGFILGMAGDNVPLFILVANPDPETTLFNLCAINSNLEVVTIKIYNSFRTDFFLKIADKYISIYNVGDPHSDYYQIFKVNCVDSSWNFTTLQYSNFYFTDLSLEVRVIASYAYTTHSAYPVGVTYTRDSSSDITL